VSCSGPNLKMKICYHPHPHVNFSGGWVMSTENRLNADDPTCEGSTVGGETTVVGESGNSTDDSANSTSTSTDEQSLWCPVGMQALTLSLIDEETNKKCGTAIAISVRIQRSLIVYSSNRYRLPFVLLCTKCL